MGSREGEAGPGLSDIKTQSQRVGSRDGGRGATGLRSAENLVRSRPSMRKAWEE